MAETFNNNFFGTGSNAVGALLLGTFTGANLISGLTGVTIDGTIDCPNSPVTLPLNIGGVAQAGIQGTYVGFRQPAGSTEPTYFFSANVAGIDTPVVFAVSNGGVSSLSVLTGVNTSNVTAPDSPTIPICFVAGTKIRTDRGDIAVEDLRIGDRVVTLHGRLETIRWIGQRSYDGLFIRGNYLALPVCIKSGALALNTPTCDLYISPGHALYIDGMLVHAHLLVNDVSITQDMSVSSVTYFNIELDQHDVILAEGTPVETFFDNGMRNVFQNAAEYAALYPEDLYRPQIVRHRSEAYAATAASGSCAARIAAGGRNPCRSISQVSL